jgi:hypothetical protein
MYNLKKNVKLYIVDGSNKHSIETYSDVTMSQTFDEQSYKRKTLHAQSDLHEGASITKANVANFSFTTPIKNAATTPIVLSLGSNYTNGNLSSFDMYMESDNLIYKIEKCVIETLTFNIQKESILTVSVSGTGSKVSLYSNPLAVQSIPGTLVNEGTTSYIINRGIYTSIAGTELASVAALNIEVSNSVIWTPYNTLHSSLQGNIAYPSGFALEGRRISGSITQFLTSENIGTLVSDTSTNSSLDLRIYDVIGAVTPVLRFNLPSVVYTKRLGVEDLINRVFDFRLNTNSTTVKPIYKGV